MINWKKAKRFWLKTFKPDNYDQPEDQSTFEFISKYASKVRWAKSVCELGVGSGDHLYHFINKYPNKDYYGNDINPYLIDHIKMRHPEIIDKCSLEIESTPKYLKYLNLYPIDLIYTYNHLMYIPDDNIDKVCSAMSFVVRKYILIKEIFTDIKYKENDSESFLKYGFARDYSKMFDDFELKNKDIENIKIDDNNIEFHIYLFKKIG